MWLRIQLEALTPLAFRAGRNPARSDTLPYVPGTSLLGGFAQAHQWEQRAPEEFAAFFLQARLYFGNCYPANFQTDYLTGETYPVYPMPSTARSCKRFKGFAFNAAREQEDRRGVTDALIPLALFALSDETKPDILSVLDTHPTSHQVLEGISGFFRRGQLAEHIGQPSQDTGLRMHTGINYQTGTVQSAVLYSRQVLAEGSLFWGHWWIEDTLWDTFHAFAAEVTLHDSLRLGTNRTRGLGQVRFNASPLEMETVDEVRTRVEEFTALFKDAATQAEIDAPAALYVPVLCTSDVLLHDPLERACLQLHGAALASVGLGDATLVFHAASVVHVQSWSSLWGLPKADDWAIGMGSVFLLALPRAEDATFMALWQLEQQGVGLRRAEGFGMISVANRFHLELAGGQWR